MKRQVTSAPDQNRPAESDGPRLPLADASGMRAELRELSSGHRLGLLVTALLLIGAAGLGLVFPIVTGWIVDSVVDSSGSGVPREFWWQLGLLAGSVVLAGAFEFGGVVAMARTMESMIARLRERYVSRALRLSEETVDSVGTGDIVSRVSSDIREISDSVPRVLPELAAAVFTLVLSLGGMALIDWRFALALLLGLPFYAHTLHWYLRTAPPVYAAHRRAEGTRSQHVLSTVNALPTVRAYRIGESRMHGIRESTWELVRWAMRARIVQNRLFGRINAAQCLGLLFILAIGFFLTATGAATVGQTTSAALLFFRVIQPIGALMFFTDDLQSAAASFARVVGVTGIAEDEDAATAGTHAASGEGGPAANGPERGDTSTPPLVHLRGVRFGYRGTHTVIDNIDMRLDHGERLALVGASGSGKTTLARLIAGTREPHAGTVHRQIHLTRIAYLSQEHHVFAGTLRENLILARPGADDARLRDALERVDAAHLLDSLPQGMDTVIGRHGHRLTAADAQHLALARLLLRDPALAILDEATAEADSEHAQLLDRAAELATRDRAAIVIAHRLSQAVACDRIIVLDSGRIVEQGSHSRLRAAGGRYAELWSAWSARSG